ncbi:hypothetical protein [Helicobacter cinaedi]|uniref:hypothetical protein n=1 Tax=Helicobacter cinaedi TaxID=213 RepID=UPI000D7C2821|nr:hypothetical protein [Helicobacter cinaedi]
MRLGRKEVIIRLTLLLGTMGFLIQEGLFKEIKGFDLFAFIFIFILIVINDIFFDHRGKMFFLLWLLYPF